MKWFVVAKLFVDSWQGSPCLASNILLVEGLDTVLEEDCAPSPSRAYPPLNSHNGLHNLNAPGHGMRQGTLKMRELCQN
jgi:hypothetical protein